MWEHVVSLIGVPGAVNATAELLKKLKGQPGNPGPEIDDGLRHLTSIRAAMTELSRDSLELVAFKDLHALTNQLRIDLTECFVLAGPSDQRSRDHWAAMNDMLKEEFRTSRKGAGGWSQLTTLRQRGALMIHLSHMPEDVLDCVPAKLTWDAYFVRLMTSAEGNIDNFASFREQIGHIDRFNDALNNYADNSLKQGIAELGTIMLKLEAQLR